MRTTLQVNSKEEGQFWARALKLEEEIEKVRQLMEVPGPRKWAAVPVVAEYLINEKCKIIYFLTFTVDNLGLNHGLGILFFADEAHWPEAFGLRDELANDILGKMEKGEGGQRFDEVIEMPLKKEA